MQTVVLKLPESIMQRARRAAEALQHPLEEVLTDVLTVGLPDVEDAPEEARAELARMNWLDNQTLWDIAKGLMSIELQMQLQQLSERQTQRLLTEAEQAQLEALRREYGLVTLRKAHAYALLSLRGGRPLLADL